MKQFLRSAFIVAATLAGTVAITVLLFQVIRPCRLAAITALLFWGLSVPPVLTYLALRYRASQRFWPSLGRALGLWVLLAFVLSIEIPTLFGAVGRARQSRAMAQLRALGRVYEAKRQAGQLKPSRSLGPIDPWQQAIIIESTATQYVLVSCGECGGSPERQDLFSYSPGPTTNFTSDIVFSNGVFVSYPEGVQQ